MTASIAVARKRGGIVSGTGGELLDHAHFHSAMRRAAQHHIVHEAAHEEDSASAGFQDVFGGEGVGNFFWHEPFSLILHAHDQFAGGRGWDEREFDSYKF